MECNFTFHFFLPYGKIKVVCDIPRRIRETLRRIEKWQIKEKKMQ